jgi:vitamin B12 transporter
MNMFDLPIAENPIVIVTASRAEETAAATPASVTLIDGDRIERLGSALLPDLLRLVPSLSVATSGPAGSLTDVRIRGAEANHTLLFVEGIRANDPAAGNAPRFELLNADLASRVEVVRGPQSALWGSEAVGGVVAVDGAVPGSGGSVAFVEGGSFDTLRGAARTTFGEAERGVSVGVAAQRSDGIDSFSGDGERDGYRNLSGRFSGDYRVTPALIVGASGFALRGTSEFDGYNPVTFLRDDTLDRTRNRLSAGRLHATFGDRATRYANLSASLLRSSNRNLVGDHLVNRTGASRRTVAIEAGQVVGRHVFIAALDGTRERFEARDNDFGGFSDQDRLRRHQSLTLEWKMRDLGPLSTDVAMRHDRFSRFKDATTVRGAASVALGHGVSLIATYGQGIAQPSFFDLYGFFPGSFAGNPELRPEKSRGGEAGLRYRDPRFNAALTLYRQRLKDEIVDIFAFPLSTTVNADGTSKRRGVEAEAGWTPSDALRLTATYALLDASEPTAPGGAQSKEQRRPRHSGSVALDGKRGRLSYGASIAYTGERNDTDFTPFPAVRVQLAPYWLGSARLAYRIAGPLEASLRIANAFGERYQDVVGYRTEGRSVHAGLRIAVGR